MKKLKVSGLSSLFKTYYLYLETQGPISSLKCLKKESFKEEKIDNRFNQGIRLRSLRDKKRREDFLLVNEKDIPTIFGHPDIANKKPAPMVSLLDSNLYLDC